MERDELKQDMEINPRALDVELLRHSEIYTKWAERAIDAKAVESNLKFQMESLEAKLLLRAYDHPEEFGIVKTTVDTVKAGVQLHPEMETAARAHRKAVKERSLFELARDQTMERKKTIGDLIELYKGQYFAGPDVPRDLISIWESRNKPGGEVTRMKARRVKKEEE